MSISAHTATSPIAPEQATLLRDLVDQLLNERGAAPAQPVPDADLWPTFRALVNTRPPVPANPEFLAGQDRLLRELIAQKGVTKLEDLAPLAADPRLRLWRGDITTLAVDVIVNAANSQMLGCWVPGHHCIDNAIHTFAGVQLRLECAGLMEAQGHDEPTGQAHITGAYNLPARHILHTVGPIVENGRPSRRQREQLASCYTSCLDLAAEQGLHSVAFCSISTGVFGFPIEVAAPIAVAAVRSWLDEHPAAEMTVVFDVFSEHDEQVYRRALAK